jgi:pimeloyl-ACP methyl ester carboxylesterase
VPSFANNLMVIHGMHLWKSLLKSTSDMMKQLSETVTLTEQQLQGISHPVLLGIGDRDQTSSVFETLETFKKLPNAALMVLPHTAHPFEKVPLELLVPAIKQFFK